MLDLCLAPRKAFFVPGARNAFYLVRFIAAMIETHASHLTLDARVSKLVVGKRIMEVPGPHELFQLLTTRDSNQSSEREFRVVRTFRSARANQDSALPQLAEEAPAFSQCLPNRRGALGWNDGAGREGAGRNPRGAGAECGSDGFDPLPKRCGLLSPPCDA